jgi:hypothetical protein
MDKVFIGEFFRNNVVDDIAVSAGVILGHITPRERRSVAV